MTGHPCPVPGNPVVPMPLCGMRVRLPHNDLSAHLADMDDPHQVAKILPNVRFGFGSPGFVDGDKPKDFYFDLGTSCLYVMRASGASSAWVRVSGTESTGTEFADAAASSATEAKASASTAASLLDAKLDRTYKDNGFAEEHAAGKVTMSSDGTAAVTLDASDGGSVTVGSAKLTSPSGKLLSNGSKVALADDVRGKADLAVYDVKGFRIDGMKMTVRASNIATEDNVTFEENIRGADVEVGDFSVAGGVASCQLGSVSLPNGCPDATDAVLKVSGVQLGDDGGYYVPIGAEATLTGVVALGSPYDFNWTPTLVATVHADGLLPSPSSDSSSCSPYGCLGLYGSVDADPYVEMSSDTLAKSSEKLDASPHNVGLKLTRDDGTELVLELFHEKSDEQVRLAAEPSDGYMGGANIRLSCGQSMASASLDRTLGLQICDEDDKESTYAVSASVGGDLTVGGTLGAGTVEDVAGAIASLQASVAGIQSTVDSANSALEEVA